MQLRIAQDVLALFPEALIGVVRVRGCDNARAGAESAALLRQAEAAARAAFAGGAGAALAPRFLPLSKRVQCDNRDR